MYFIADTASPPCRWPGIQNQFWTLERSIAALASYVMRGWRGLPDALGIQLANKYRIFTMLRRVYPFWETHEDGMAPDATMSHPGSSD